MRGFQWMGISIQAHNCTSCSGRRLCRTVVSLVSLHWYLPSFDCSDIVSCVVTPPLWEATASRPVSVVISLRILIYTQCFSVLLSEQMYRKVRQTKTIVQPIYCIHFKQMYIFQSTHFIFCICLSDGSND